MACLLSTTEHHSLLQQKACPLSTTEHRSPLLSPPVTLYPGSLASILSKTCGALARPLYSGPHFATSLWQSRWGGAHLSVPMDSRARP